MRKPAPDTRKYNFIIARFWNDNPKQYDNDSLCSYAYGSTVWHDTKEFAESLAVHISKKAGETYKPVYIDTHNELTTSSE